MKIYCNAGVVHINQMETLPGYGLLWFNGYVISKILYMANTTEKLPVYYDNKTGDMLILQKADDQLFFNRSPSSLYFQDIRYWDIIMVANTTGNHEGYTKQKVLAATEAQKGMATMDNP